MDLYYLDDLVPGQQFVGHTRIRIEAERPKWFASEFDPQPFHLDDSAASVSIFRGLAASGWHTAAVTMRLLVDSEFKPASGIVGPGFDDLRWPLPVRPGDELRVEVEVLEVRPSKSRLGPRSRQAALDDAEPRPASRADFSGQPRGSASPVAVAPT